jgi:hypothetical protein
MKTPDRFERMVLKAMKKQDMPRRGLISAVLTASEVVALLRKEHREVVRLVKQELLEAQIHVSSGSWHRDGRITSYCKLLKALENRMT